MNFGLTANELIKVYVTRGKIKENISLVAVSVIDEDLKQVFSSSDDHYLVYPRSSVKMIQALPLILSGAYQEYNLTNQHLALASASHHGEEIHTELVVSWLNKMNVDYDLLHCGVMPPISKEVRADLIKTNTSANKYQHMCSGKHTAMMCYAIKNKWPVLDYYKQNHLVQGEVAKVFSEFTDLDVSKYPHFKDGCSVPTYAIPLANWALAIAKFVTGKKISKDQFYGARKIYKAQAQHPELITSQTAIYADLIRDGKNKFVAKSGADGVEVIAVDSPKLGIAIKSIDGSSRPALASLIAILKSLKLVDENKSYLKKITTTYGDIVGQVEVEFPPNLVANLNFENTLLTNI